MDGTSRKHIDRSNLNDSVTETEAQPEIAKRLQRHSLPMGALGMDLHTTEDVAFVSCMDGVYELDLATGDASRLYEHESYAANIVYVAETNQVISSGYDGALQWFDVDNKRLVRHVQAHSFWSWDLAKASTSPLSVPIVASVSGQYLAGSYDYRPRAATEPCVQIYNAINGKRLFAFDHLPPVQAVAISSDGRFVGVGNLMGDVGVWDLQTGKHETWNTPDFTGFGIIKSHCQIGGIYAATFSQHHELIVAGMGPMRDPMAGNGKQRWQRFDVRDAGQKLSASKDGQAGEGLMETLAMHPDGRHFAMAGRLRGGSWNVGIFDVVTSDLVHSFKTDTRVTKAVFSTDGDRLYLAAADKQHAKAEKSFGVLDVYAISLPKV